MIVEGGGLQLWDDHPPPLADLPPWLHLGGAPDATPSWIPVLAREAWRALAFGSRRACGIDATGRALCTGTEVARDDAELVVLDAGPVSRIDVGGFDACTIDDAGRVACRGGASPVMVDGLDALPPAIDVALGDAHACIATVDGETICWGSGLSGRLGDGVLAYRRRPQQPRAAQIPRGARAVAAAGATTCAIADRRVWCWGHSAWGQAGPGDHRCQHVEAIEAHACQFSPAEIDLPAAATDVVVSRVTSCAILEGGELWCWGVVPGAEYPAWPSRTASRDCWISPRPVLRGVAEVVASDAGRICAMDASRRRVACFGADAPAPSSVDTSLVFLHDER